MVVAKQGNELLNIEADEILLALGRRPNVEGLNLEAAGVKYDNRSIQVNEYLQISTSNILAIGDVTGGYFLTGFVCGVLSRMWLRKIASRATKKDNIAQTKMAAIDEKENDGSTK